MTRRLLFLLFFSLILFAGCNKDNGNNSGALTTYPVAGLFSLTGNWSSLGLTSQEVLNIAVKDVNTYLAERRSSIRFSATVYDTKLDTALAKTYFQTAINTLKSKFIIGPQSSAEVGALREMANNNNTLLISQGSTASSLALPSDAVFRFCPGDGPEGSAISRTAYQSGKRMMITLARNDAGNLGLQSSVNRSFAALGGQTDALSPYSTSQTDFSSVLSTLRAKIQQQVATYGAAGVGVYLASFDECAILFRQSYNDPILSSVNWFGGNGVVLSAALLADADAKRFAAAVSFFAPNFGLPAQAHPKLSGLVTAVRTKTGLDPDAYAISVYDAVWVLATTVADFPITASDFSALKARFSEQANRYFGASGPVMLDVNGDRASGASDYWGIVNEGGNYSWKVVGKSN
ncbi:MAG: ABC transporter substrate-binding protein [Bacteroidota bacterium]